MKVKNSAFWILIIAVLLVMTGCSKVEQTSTESVSANTNTPQSPDRPINTGEEHPLAAADLSEAAAKLGITEDQLQEALSTGDQQQPDLAAAANILGISVEELREALGFQQGNFPAGEIPTGEPPEDFNPTDSPRPDMPPTDIPPDENP